MIIYFNKRRIGTILSCGCLGGTVLEKNIDFGHVADIYDYYANVDFDIGFFKTLCKGHKKILELMCGTGRVSIPLIKEGYQMTCVDYSEEMLDVFRKKIGIPRGTPENVERTGPEYMPGNKEQIGPGSTPGIEEQVGPQDESQDTSPNGPQNVRIVCQDVCELDLGERFDLIIIPSNSISEIIDKEKRRQALRRIARHLTRDGIFFCTLYNPEYRKSLADGQVRYLGKYDLGDGRSLVVTYYNVFSPETGIISGSQFYEIYERGLLKEKRCLDIKFAVITIEEICKMAREAGLCLKAVYGDYEPYHYDESSMFMNLLFIRKKRCERISRKRR